MNATPPSFEPTNPRRRPSDRDAVSIGKGPHVRRNRPAVRQRPEVRRDPAPVAPEPRPASFPPAGTQRAGEAEGVSFPPASRPVERHRPHRSTASASAPRDDRSAPSLPPVLPPRTPRKKRRTWPWIVTPLVVLLVILVAWPLYLISYGNSRLQHVGALSGAGNTPGTTYLIVGSDKRQAEAINDGTEGERSDSIMVLHVPESGKAALVSIPRDSYVEIPDHGSGKINSSYSLGGPELLVRTVENLTGMTIDHYVEVSMFGVQELTDAVGGINLCLDYDVADEYSGLVWSAGCADVDGATALAFSRMRYSDPLGDIGRTLRQRQVVGKIIDKAASGATLVNPARQKALVGTAATSLTTDTDTSILGLARAALGMRDVMGPDGLMGTPPISSLNLRVGGQSAVELDPDLVDSFFEKMKNGNLSADDFQSVTG
ncbi:LCP family protein [Arcanobacterium haemolyticum]|nr:LCP family protein [Arcanobacterium haemolyticum]